ncbi:MAG: glycosyltransferase family 2 protein [Chloroflexota bacterium]
MSTVPTVPNLPPAPVTVIVPTFNRAPVLRVTLESLRRQTFRDWRAIVVGDGCTDGSGEMVAGIGDPRIRWHNRPQNGGSQAWANNDGVALADTPWIAYLTHDDLWMPWHLAQMVETARGSGADFVHALCLMMTPAGVIRFYGEPIEAGAYAAHPMPPCSWMHRRELWERIGGWADPDRIARSPDHDFQHRAAVAGAAFAFAPRLSVLYFPASGFGRAYQNDRPPLQAPFARWIAEDPEWLEHALLTEAAAVAARREAAHADVLAAAIFARGNTPEAVAAFQEKRRANRRFRGLGEVPVPVPPPVVRRCLRQPPPAGAHAAAALRVEVDGLTHTPTVLLDGVPLDTISAGPGMLLAMVPAGLLAAAGAGAAAVQVLSGGGISAPFPLPAGGR